MEDKSLESIEKAKAEAMENVRNIAMKLLPPSWRRLQKALRRQRLLMVLKKSGVTWRSPFQTCSQK